MSIFGGDKPTQPVQPTVPPMEPTDLPDALPTTGSVQEKVDVDAIVGGIERELSERAEDMRVDAEGDEPRAKTPAPFDFSTLTPDQLNSLREMFEKTPRRKSIEEKYNTVSMRVIGGRIAIGWGRAFLGLVDNPVENRKDMRQMIKVQFAGSKDETTMLYREFMQAERITCRVIETKTEQMPQEVGTTFKRDEDGGLTSQEVVMYVNHVKTTFTIQLPDGTTAQVDAERVN